MGGVEVEEVNFGAQNVLKHISVLEFSECHEILKIRR